jgi:hypothetical protein
LTAWKVMVVGSTRPACSSDSSSRTGTTPPLGNGHVGGEAAVARSVGRDAVRFGERGVAVLGVPPAAHCARAARGPHGGDHPLPDTDATDLRPGGDHGSVPLVPEDRRRQHLGCGEPVHIGAAYPAIADLHHHLAARRLRYLDFGDVQFVRLATVATRPRLMTGS